MSPLSLSDQDGIIYISLFPFVYAGVYAVKLPTLYPELVLIVPLRRLPAKWLPLAEKSRSLAQMAYPSILQWPTILFLIRLPLLPCTKNVLVLDLV